MEVTDLELRGTWVVDVRRHPRAAERTGWLLEWEDDIAPSQLQSLADSPELPAEEASEQLWPVDAA